MQFLPNRPSKLGPGRTVTAPLHLRGDAAVVEVQSQRGCDLEAHVNKFSSHPAPVESPDSKLTGQRSVTC
jgi:hypothetical protein